MRKFPDENNVCITNEKNFSKKKTFTSPMRKFPDKNNICITNEAAESSGRRKMKSSNSQWRRLDIIITMIKYVINRNDINNHRSLPHDYVTNKKGWLYPLLPVACRPREARVWRAIQEPKRWITIIWRKINMWSNPSHHLTSSLLSSLTPWQVDQRKIPRQRLQRTLQILKRRRSKGRCRSQDSSAGIVNNISFFRSDFFVPSTNLQITIHNLVLRK